MTMIKQNAFKRSAGVLMPVSSLPSAYGIGTFGKEAYKFVDFVKKSDLKYWQVLPLGPTSYGDSPYQSFSAFAGNPYFIDLDILCNEKLLKKSDYENIDFGQNPNDVDYAKIYENRFTVLRIAYNNSEHKKSSAYLKFVDENSLWLDEYSQYMAIKMYYGGKSMLEWDKDIYFRRREKLAPLLYKLEDDIDFWKFLQYKFFEQWQKLKDYANDNGIDIIGDIPIYVSLDSADVWLHSDQFQLDENKYPTAVAGVPPDAFSSTGQLWGNPLYDWNKMEQDDFAWWKNRIAYCCKMYDVVRIDHFVGIAHYYSIPYGEQTAENGKWVDGPSMKLINAISTVTNGKKVIAEDLGIVIDDVREIQKASGYPGMKVLEFALDEKPNPQNDNLSTFYTQNSVVYGGTHDNETLVGFLRHQNEKTIKFAKEYFNVKGKDIDKLALAIIKDGFRSVSNLAIFQLQDFLLLDNSARINTPSTLGQNWRWRVDKKAYNDELASKIKKLCFTFNR